MDAEDFFHDIPHGARVFTTAPGNYGFGLDRFVERSRDKDEPETMTRLYLTKMNSVCKEKSWGASSQAPQSSLGGQ